MKKLLHSFTLRTLALVALLATAIGAWADGTGTAVTTLAGITEGTYYIASLNDSKYYGVPSTTINGQTFTCIEGSYSNPTFTPAEGTGEFEFTAVTGVDNAFYIYNTTLAKYLVATGSKKFEYVESNSTDYGYWTFSTVTSGGFSGVFSVKHSNKSHYMRAYTNSVRCYDGTSNNGVYLFKKNISSSTAVATPTFSPAAGAVAAGTEVSIACATADATIHYTTDGSTPTTASATYADPITVNEDMTIKAIAVKEGMDPSEVAEASYTVMRPVSGYNIDFESDLDLYVDWEMKQVGRANHTITAHGGSYYGTTDGNSSATIKTKDAIAYPGTFTCYVSKITTNNKDCTWKVQVSNDDSEWTDVETLDASNKEKGTWVEFTANLSAYTNVYVRLYYSGSTAIRAVDDISLTMRDPNAKVTPDVTIDATSLTTTDTEGQSNVSAGSLTAKVTSGEATIDTPAVTWSSSNEAVATIDAQSGAVTLIAAGTTTITASFAGNDDYTEATATYELTVVNTYAKGALNNPYTVAEARAAIDANEGIADVYVKGIVSGIVTAYSSQYGNISYNISDDGTTSSDQLEAFRGLSYNGAKFTSANDIKVRDVVVIFGTLTKYNDTYEFAEKNQLVSLQREKGDAVIVVEDSKVAYGSTFTIDTEMIEGGDISLTSENEAVATVSGLTVTPVAVGTTIITVTTAETEFYKAGSETFKLTVTAPEGKEVAPTTAFAKVTSTSELTNGQYLIVYETDNVAFNGGLETLDASSNTISVTISDGTIAATDETKAATFTIDNEAGTLQSASGKYIGVSSNSNGLKQTDDASTYTNSFAIDDNGNAVISAVFNNANMTMRYNSASNQSRFRYYGSGQQAVQLYKFNEATDITITLNAKGYATYCSQYPLDFTDAEADGYSAWAVSDISGTEIKFSQITGSIKGGQGILLKGKANATITLTSTDSENVLSDNLLEGTLAPTYVETGKYFGLKDNTFVKVNAGTVKAGKALLDADLIGASDVKGFTFIFEDDATGINEMKNEEWRMKNGSAVFNLAGQRISRMQKGINIVNGKKVIVK